MFTGFIGQFVRRREVVANGPHTYGVDRNVRPVTQPPPQDAPEPPRQGDVNSRLSQMQIATFFNIAGINSVMEDHPLNDLRVPANWISDIPGSQHPWVERPIVDRDDYSSYGALHVLTPPQYSGGYDR